MLYETQETVTFVKKRYSCDICQEMLMEGAKPYRCDICEKEVCLEHLIYLDCTALSYNVCQCCALQSGWIALVQDEGIRHAQRLAHVQRQWKTASRRGDHHE